MSRFLNNKSLLFIGLLLALGLVLGAVYRYERILDTLQQYGESVFRNSGVIRKPTEIGSGGRSKYAYVKLNLSFRVDDDDHYGGLFQTDDFNKGVRLEIHDGDAVLVVANSRKRAGYDLYVIPEKIVKNRWYRLEVEVQNKGYVMLSLDGKKLFDVIDHGVSASMSRMVIGRGFDRERIFYGEIERLEVRSGDSSKFLRNLKLLNHLQFETNFRLLGNLIVLGLALTFWRKGQKNEIEKRIVHAVTEKRQLLLPVFVVVQVLLMWTIEAYRSVVSGYLLLFVIGGALYPLIAPPSVTRQRSISVIWPVIGLVCMSILGGYLIGYSVSPSLYVLSYVMIVGLVLAINATFNRKRFLFSVGLLRDDFADLLIYGTVLITPVVLVMIYPVLATGYMTSVYRVGPDLMQYAKMADYLMNGGTLALSKMRAPEFAGMTPGEMNRYADATMSWPLMNYFRWGLTFYQVVLGKILGLSHSYQIVFVSMVIPYLLEAGVVYIWLRKINGSVVFVAFFGFIFCIFNVNMLNLWYEGFLGNAYANVLLLWVVMLFAQLMDNAHEGLREQLQYVLLIGVVMAALFLSYGEVLLFVFPLFIFLVMVAEFLICRKIQWINYFTLLGGGLLGFVIVLPCNYVFEWAGLTINQLLQEGGNGYAQPLWAMPHDILGYGDIYAYLTLDNAGKLMERTVVDMVVGWLLAATGAGFMMYDVVTDRLRSRVLKIAGLMIVATAGVFVYMKSPNNNYTYMKVYVLFAPIMIIAFVGGVTRWSIKTSDWEGTRIIRLLVFTLPVMLNGILYIVQYARQSTVIEKVQLELAGKARGVDFKNVLILPYNLGNKRVIYTAIMPGLWAVPEYWNVKHWGDKPYYQIHAGKRLYLLAKKERNVLYKVNGDIVFENGSYLIVDSKKIVKDVFSNGKLNGDFKLALNALKVQLQGE